MADFKFSKISISDFYNGNKTLKREFSAKIYDIEENTMQKTNDEKYGRFWLRQGKSKIVALAYGGTYELLKNVLQNVELVDEKSDVTISSIVIYNSVCELLLNKSGHDFDTDDEAAEAWQEIINRGRFDVTLKRQKKQKSSPYTPAIFVDKINNVVEDASFISAEVESTIVEVEDASVTALPDFLKYEMKLQQTAEPYKEWAEAYQINSKPRGLVLLINNYNFPHMEETQRVGSKIDIEYLQEGFLEMGYKIYGDKCQTDVKTKMEFGELIRGFKDELLEQEVDSIFIVISSHGMNLQVELCGGESICLVEGLMILFSDDNFPQYQGKPKIFMPLVCQSLGREEFRKSLHCQTNKLFDMLVCCPALPGYTQMRCHANGTLFVNLLMFNLMKYAMSWDFVQILNKVQADFKEQILRNNLVEWTVPHHHGSTFRPLYLVPKEIPGSNMEVDMEVD